MQTLNLLQNPNLKVDKEIPICLVNKQLLVPKQIKYLFLTARSNHSNN